MIKLHLELLRLPHVRIRHGGLSGVWVFATLGR